MPQVPGHCTNFKCSTNEHILTCNTKFLGDSYLQFEFTDDNPEPSTEETAQNPLVPHWMVFLKTRPIVKSNKAEFTNVPTFTLLLMCSTKFSLSWRIFLAFATSNNSVPSVFTEIPGESVWEVLFRPPWCWFLLWPLQFIRTGLGCILDFWYKALATSHRKFLYLIQNCPR